MVLLGSVMAAGLSLLSGNYYFDGLDRGLNVVMLDLAKTTEVKAGESHNVAGFNAASRWQDTPDIIQQRFIAAPAEAGVIHKLNDQESFFSKPKSLYFVVLYYSPQGEKRFISKVMLEKEIDLIRSSIQSDELLFWMFFTAFSAIVIFAIFLALIMLKIAKPIESLREWARLLNQDNLNIPPPDFTYNELNVLASLVQSSLISAHQSLAREQRFLSYASHELRTPISVVRSNVDLLQRLSEKAPLTGKQQLTLQRIQRAGLTMSDLTDTLLWLSRTDEQAITPEPISLHDKIKQLCCDLNYLLNEKNVEVTIESEEGSVKVEAVACHIVLSNLIRNAYQYTQDGTVHINQQGSRVTIVNSNTSNDLKKAAVGASSKQVSLGYGLGLQLSEKIINRHGWFYEVADTQGGYHVTVDFDCNKQSVTATKYQ
jgi:signal transduction histidine kinase